jgi:hypothetical protein
MPFIYETVVYCGRMKHFRILNINTGTVYASDFPTRKEAEDAIEDGKERAGCIVYRVTMTNITSALDP